MKRILLILLVAFSTLPLCAQIIMPNASKHDFAAIYSSYNKADDKGAIALKLNELYPVYKLNGVVVVSTLAKKNTAFSKSTLEALGILVGAEVGDIVTLKIPVPLLNALQTLPGLNYLEIAGKIKPLLDRAVKDMRADSVQRGYTLPQAYTGQDVMIGITDWGFDYTHPMFYDTLLTQTRIHAAWDQYKSVGNVPTTFNYGVEFTTVPELLAAGSDTNNIYGIHYHGSHVAGIAGGSGAGTQYRGLAPNANFLFTTFLVDNGSVLDAFAWMKEKANAAGKRLVINMSWGLYHIGSLDGNSLLNQAIDTYSTQGLVFVSSAGNNGAVNFHMKKTFVADTLKSEVQFYPYAGTPTMYGQSISAWGEVGHDFKIRLKVMNSSGIQINQSPLYDIQTTTAYIDSIILVNADTVFFNLSADYAHPNNNRPFARMRIKNTHSNYRILIEATALDGTVHFWNVTELTNDVGNWGQAFLGTLAGTTTGDKLYGIGDPASTESVITIAAYNAGFLSGTGVPSGGGIASFSSFGPTLDERVKPDVAAPGQNVISSINHLTTNSFTLFSSVTFNTISYPFAKLSGTSMSSPAVTGTVALLLDANPNLSAWDIKNCLKTSARADNLTGVIPVGGSTRWGAGKVNALAAVKCALTVTELDEFAAESFTIYPNPASTEMVVVFPNFNGELYLLDANGKLLLTRNFHEETVLNFSDFEKGIYFLRLGNTVKKVIVI